LGFFSSGSIIDCTKSVGQIPVVYMVLHTSISSVVALPSKHFRGVVVAQYAKYAKIKKNKIKLYYNTLGLELGLNKN